MSHHPAAPLATQSPVRGRVLRVGLLYDLLGGSPAPPGAPPDWDAEFEPEQTRDALESAIRRLNHVPVRIGSARNLLDSFKRDRLSIDVAVNISEGYGTRNREAHAPILLELLGIPCVGSDALALSTSLDKHLSKLVARQTGVRTPDWIVARSGSCLTSMELPPFPVIVKPRYEGTAKGITQSSKCHDERDLEREVTLQHDLYRQDVLIETFVNGGEFTVGVVGHEPPSALPPLQRATDAATGIGSHALEDAAGRRSPRREENVGMTLEPELDDVLRTDALRMHQAMECLDFSRSDFRVDPDGRSWFLEINPLPTFSPDDTFAILAEIAGEPYDLFLSRILHPAIERLGF